jgi:sulfite exporter TauE/SafE
MQFLVIAMGLGFLGSFHCIGMCGPIALALPLNNENSFRKIVGSLLYNTGRIITYGCLGLLFGLLGKGFIIAGYQQALSITLGILVLVMVLLPQRYAAKFGVTRFAFSFMSRVKSRLGQLFSKKSYEAMLSIGLLNGLLPCGLVYMGVAGAIATGDPLKGSTFMMAFGLGTLPAMLFITMASHLITLNVRNRMRKAVPFFVVAMACMLILRGMNLGIPYISPELSKTDCTKHTCCRK